MKKAGGVVAIAFLLSLGTFAPSYAADPKPAPPKPAPSAGAVQTLKGQVVKIESDTYVVKDATGKEIRLRVNQETVLQADLHVGDKVDAEVAPDGHALTLLRALQ